jgi:hypothetical protein
VDQPQLNWIANYIWGIADDVLRDLYVRGKLNGRWHYEIAWKGADGTVNREVSEEGEGA